MTRRDAEFQAAELAYFIKGGGSARRWWSSRGFNASDRRMIQAELRRIKVEQREGRRLAL